MLWGWLSAVLAVGIVGVLAFWLRRKAAQAEEYYDREYKTPTLLDFWSRGDG